MAKKGKPQLRDLGRFKSGEEIKRRVTKATQTGNRRLYSDLRLKEKAANERMRQLEKRNIKSPAYLAVQAKLEVLGKQTKGDRGRRFSETGKATYSEKMLLNKILDEFLEMDTSTIKGAKRYSEDVWNSANKNNQLAAAGISRGDWLKFWESMPDRKDRLYGSSQNVAMIRAFTIKREQIQNMSDKERAKLIKEGKLTDEQLEQFTDDKFSVQEIADEIQASKNLKNAYARLGLTYSEVQAAKIKRRPKARV